MTEGAYDDCHKLPYPRIAGSRAVGQTCQTPVGEQPPSGYGIFTEIP